MKIRIELNESYEEPEVVIHCATLTPEVIALENQLSGLHKETEPQLLLYKDETEYFVNLYDILFFETDSKCVQAHTAKEVFETKHKLYELENMLPAMFLRISKSSIVNCSKIYSVNRNLTAASEIAFTGTHKTVFASRSYYKALKAKLEEKRLSL